VRPASFPPAARLRLPSEFNHVFRSGARSSDACFVVLASSNALGSARLGITVAKKNVASAAKRTRIKRAVRESFRLNRALLPAVDIVVQARNAARQHDNAGLRSSLDRHWQELIKRCKDS
jgi:ribonuclease P protein component